jgi:hypothetical protein
MNYENDELVRVLRSNIQNLINLYKKEREENTQLSEKNSEFSEKLRIKEKECAELELKYNTLRMAKMLVGKEDDALQAKSRVNGIVREIDRCIALLNK